MKIRILLLLSCFIPKLILAQTDSVKTPEAKTFEMFDIQNPPKFPGGEDAMMQFIGQNLKYPALAKENLIQGTVILTFVIEPDGSISTIQTVKDIGGGCGKEAMRMVSSMPKWTRGEADGRPVKVRYTLPIRFKLEDGKQQPAASPKGSSGQISSEEMWKLVAEAAKNICKLKEPVERSSALGAVPEDDQKLFSGLELAFKVKLSDADKMNLKNVGQVVDYFELAQFAPALFTAPNFRGQQAKFLTSRADFDANADGLGKLGSIQVPQGIRLIFYSKKNFKGKKLEINALNAPVEIADMATISEEKGRIKNGDKKVNWAVNTQSLKITLPKGFPEGE